MQLLYVYVYKPYKWLMTMSVNNVNEYIQGEQENWAGGNIKLILKLRYSMQNFVMSKIVDSSMKNIFYIIYRLKSEP